MLSFSRIESVSDRAGPYSPVSAAFVVSLSLTALTMGGCSADISRFDLSNYSLNGSSDSTASLPTPSAPMARPSLGGRIDGPDRVAPAPAPSYDRRNDDYASGAAPKPYPDDRFARNDRFSSSDLPPPRAVRQPRVLNAAPPLPPRSENRLTGYAAGSKGAMRVAALPEKSPPASGTITVRSGDTLYGLSRRHGVSVSELMSANGLTNPMIRPGQTLYLSGRNRPAPRVAAPARPAYQPPARAVARAPVSPRASTGQGGSYKILPGNSFYRIARAHGIRTVQLRAANPGIDPRRMRPGTMIRIPGQSGSSTITAAPRRNEPARTAPVRMAKVQPAANVVADPPRVVSTAPSRLGGNKGPRIINSAARKPVARSAQARKPVRVAALGKPEPRSSAGKFRWPVQGKVIAKFGARADGTHNDGINVSVPQGTPVKAAENGVVAYAGDELKGYGHLVLIRHENNWVTAYAHNDRLQVKRGDKVRRGDVIAKAGRSGTVDQPQVHFELRKGSKPVNPLPYLR